ncbi:MAG: FtsX-like permease family protein [Flavobacteriia bacterium]|nr:FtsX-like permease family protein [Flavobacteriia bacterium]
MVVTSAAMVILLSAFNGIEGLITELYTDFDQEIVITPKTGKTATASEIKTIDLFCSKLKGVHNTSVFLQERVVLRNKKKWVNADMWAVEPSFYQMAKVKNSKHLVNGALYEKEQFALIGIGLAQKLGMKSMQENNESLVVYTPKQNIRIGFGKNPFYQDVVDVSGALDYNKEINEGVFLVGLDFAKKHQKEDRLTGLLVSATTFERENIKDALLVKFSEKFNVKTNLEKNELIFKTSKSEKLIVIAILIFVFILSLFNLVASLTMMFLEKRETFVVLKALGFHKKPLKNLFVYVGMLIVTFGLTTGLFAGTVMVWIQIHFEVLLIPGSFKAFPVAFSINQMAGISVLLVVLGWVASKTTATFLFRMLPK